MKKIDFETLWGGIFGAVAVIAVLIEMVIGRFDGASIAGGIKDIAGTLITILMLFVAIRALKAGKRTTVGFDEEFEKEMKLIMEKYNPIISFFGVEKINGIDMNRYNIANKLDAISTNNPGGNHKFFRITSGVKEISFSVSETVFPSRKEVVATRISSKLALTHNDYIENIKPNEQGFSIIFRESLSNTDDARIVAKIIDHTILLYIAEYKKS